MRVWMEIAETVQLVHVIAKDRDKTDRDRRDGVKKWTPCAAMKR